MERNYTYEVTENGYYILLNGKRWMHQYENDKECYIPDKNKSYEENAIAQIEELKKSDEEALKKQNEITLEERVAILEDLAVADYERSLS